MKYARNAVLGVFVLLIAVAASTVVVSKPNPTAISTVLISTEGGHGSGVHIGDGFIITAAHVVEDRAEMRITDSAGNDQMGAVLWANKAHDIALIRVGNRSNLRQSSLVCSPSLLIGDEIQAVGSPINIQFVHVWGRVATGVIERGPWKQSFIADMTIAQGMSGGPVFDRSGGIVGIAVGIAVLPQMMAVAPLAISYIVPSSAVCMLMARK